MTRSDALVASALPGGAQAPLEPDSPLWERAGERRLALQPAPVGLAVEVSPYLSRSYGHGRIREVRVRLLRDAERLAIRLVWADATRDDRLADLDAFADAAAVMFPLSEGATALTMGAAQAPVNLWLWKADRPEPFDLVARGFSSSRRRPAAPGGLEARARHADGIWRLVFRRPLAAAAEERVELAGGPSVGPPDRPTSGLPEGRPTSGPSDRPTSGLAVAVWDGDNAERAGQKSISGEFLPLYLEPVRG